MNQNPKDNAKVLCYWDQDQPGGEASAICVYKQDGFYFDGTLQIKPTWWEYLAEFESPADARLRTALRIAKDDLSKARREIKDLETEAKRWKPRPMSEAPKDGSLFWAVYRLGTSLGFVQSWHVSAVVQMDADGVIRKPDGEPLFQDFIGWYLGHSEEELNQIGGKA